MSLVREIHGNPNGSHELSERDESTSQIVRTQHVEANEDLEAAIALFWPPNIDDARAARIAVLSDYVTLVINRSNGLTDAINGETSTVAEVNALDISGGWPATPV